MNRPRQPDVFISYSHRADHDLAPAVRTGLAHLARPWTRTPALRVFLDENDLTATPTLWPDIEKVLADSRYFLLLASPEAAASGWVRDEVDYWRRHKDPSRFLFALTDGTAPQWDAGTTDYDWGATDALPDVLRGYFTHEPKWVDLRDGRFDRPDLRDLRFQDAIATLAARVHGRSKSDLVGEDIQQQRTFERRRNAAVAGLVGLLVVAILTGIGLFFQVRETREQRDAAELQARIATSRALAAQAANLIGDEDDLAYLLALEGLRLGATRESVDVLNRALANDRLARTLRGHRGPVPSVAFNANATLVASGGWDSTARVWDARSSRQLRQLEGHTGGVSAVAFSPKDAVLVTAGNTSDATVRVWSTETWEQVVPPLPQAGGAGLLAFSPDASLLASAGSGDSVRLWDTRTWTELSDPVIHPGGVTALAFGADGTLATGGADRTVRLWNPSTRQLLGAPLPGADQGATGVTSMSFSPDMRLLAIADANLRGTVTLLDLATRTAIGDPLQGHSSVVPRVAFSADGRWLATASWDGDVRLWDPNTRQQIGEPLTGHDNPLFAVTFSAVGRQLAVGTGDGSVRLLDPDNVKETGGVLRGHRDSVTGVEFNGDEVVTAGLDGTVRRWDPKTGKPAGKDLIGAGDPLPPGQIFRTDDSRVGYNGPVTAMAMRPGPTLVGALGLIEEDVWIWDVENGKKLVTELDERDVEAIAFHPSRDVLAAGSDGTVRLWDARTGRQLVGSPIVDAGTVSALAFHPRTGLLAVGAFDGSARVFDIDTGKPIGPPLVGGTGKIEALAFDPTGERLAVAGVAVQLWDLPSGQPLGPPMRGDIEGMNSVDFHPSGKLLATGGDDKTVRLWNAQTRQQVGEPLRGHSGPITSTAFHGGGEMLVSASDDDTARVWGPALWIREACRRAGRNLTETEWDRYLGDRAYTRTCQEFDAGEGAEPNAGIGAAYPTLYDIFVG
ncbi:toll/interleukin-1 receptor domain-containing protein [Nocardia sp. NPDC058114]|uniref:toll/interleukin-1 receptor domain-containing protein n=1 Tax=Nocardia sp. NPDC058114 TaxID=3346346 RepID=UPI0036DA4A6A